MKRKPKSEFAKFVLSQNPIYDMEILSDIRPFDFRGSEHPNQRKLRKLFNALLPKSLQIRNPFKFRIRKPPKRTFDRFREVFPNVTKSWNKSTLLK